MYTTCMCSCIFSALLVCDIKLSLGLHGVPTAMTLQASSLPMT